MANLKDAYKLLHAGALALQKSEYTGLHVDVDYCQKKSDELTKEIDAYEKEILESEIGKIWIDTTDEEDFSIDSSPQLGRILYTEMGIKPVKYTDGGRGSTDEEALEQLEIPVLDSYLKMRKLKKMRNTYFSQFLEENTDGILHPYFNLHTVKTFRSSSSNPNFQNIPKHGENAAIIRRAFVPSKGHQFLEMDYSGIEVRVAASIVGDPRLKQDVLTGDMHRDMAMELYALEDFDYNDAGDKQLRYGAKNGFVFAQFYGSYWKQCAPILLKHAENVNLRMGCTALENLRNLGFIELNDNGRIVNDENYYYHVREVEKDFWDNRYQKYDTWKNIQWKRYLKVGRVDYPTGFSIYGKMRRNEVLNCTIQGSAFHVLLLAFIMINNERINRKWRTKIIGQIHDAIIFDVYPPELEEVYETSKDIMENKVCDIWSWIKVPLAVEAELFEVDAPWVGGKPYVI